MWYVVRMAVPSGGLLRRAVRTPQQARSRRTRERILAAAVACFEAHGYDETTTGMIARRAHIAVGSFYGYFTDKRAILLELVDGTIDEIASYVVAALEPAAWRDADPRAGVRRLIDTLVHTRTFNPGMQRILWERYFKDAEFRDALLDIERRVRSAMVALFDALHADGRLRVSDRPTAAFVVYAAVEWIASRLMLSEAGTPIDLAVDAASDMVSRFLFRDTAVAPTAPRPDGKATLVPTGSRTGGERR
jgi:AcrR family transcriptional regulator